MNILDWKENEAKKLETAFNELRASYGDLKYPCYSGTETRFLVSFKFEYCYLFLTDNSIVALLWSSLPMSKWEIPYSQIKKIQIKRRLIRSQYKIVIKAKKKYKFYLYEISDFQTPAIGTQTENVGRLMNCLKERFDLV